MSDYVCPQCGPDPSGEDAHAQRFHVWPPSFFELDLERGWGIKPEDIASYSYPPGDRERYTDEGWEKYSRLASVECKPLLHLFWAQGEPCLCGAVQWGQPSNSA